MVLDTKGVVFGERPSIESNSLMIIEQLPGMVEINDVTDHLKFGYWPSYNVPYGENIYDNSNITNTMKSKPERKMESYNEYNSCSRANIMRRDQNKVTDIESMKEFMQYNDYLNDPFSSKDPTQSIAARGDLRTGRKMCFGAFDTKLGSVKELKENVTKTIYLYSGATKQVTLLDFKSEACNGVRHEGIPDVPDYQWVTFANKYNFEE